MERTLRVGDPGYPARLRELARPPDPVYLRGPWNHEGPVVAIVGSRTAPPDGLEMARRLARELAREGVAIVSGLAHGIDAAAHEGALEAGGRTGAALGTAIDRSYPHANRALQTRVAGSLGLMSELPSGANATRGTFSTRNRLIAAMAHAVVVVQGGEGSGTLHAVEAAERLGRPVGAVPWHADDPYAAMPHALIRERRAVLVRHADDVLALVDAAPTSVDITMGAMASAIEVAAAIDPRPRDRFAEAAPERRVLAGLSRRAQPLDVVAARSELGAAETSAALLTLELAGLARREPGGRYRLARGA